MFFCCELIFASQKPVKDFSLISSRGKVSLSDYRGKVVMIFFGFTACSDVCPISLLTISQVFKSLDPLQLELTKALFISLDPERDTSDHLQQYTNFFHENIIGLTEDPEKIKYVANNFGVKYTKKQLVDSVLGYVIYHSSDIYLIDHKGVLAGKLPHDTKPLFLQKNINKLLKNID